MENRLIYITEFDFDRLQAMIGTANLSRLDKAHLRELKAELEQAEIVAPQEIPPDVVTMNSRVRLRDLDSKEDLTYSLVFPNEENIEQQKISILAPIGVALIGYRVGDVIKWTVPGGVRRLTIKEILYQPEAAGDYHR